METWFLGVAGIFRTGSFRCIIYTKTQQRCRPCVTYSEYRGDELYHACRPSAPIP
ncbi:hypothetical protein CKAH01_15052 [Colletotrichum kahawae]|uniref:Uncharacterized protein n=1 Tax=Colletotrichum kahawae TaxID=34407 RepID=A0AAD9YK92_COLKA|nr:hypothetical protein CKAH01_15052 [Colletotrichum kahawae]